MLIRHRIFERIVLIAILGLAAYLRLVNGTNTPGWYTDEGTHIDIARHLMQGQFRYMAIDQSILLFGRPPLFGLLLAAVFQLWGVGMDSLRLLTGLIGVISVGTLYVVIRCTSSNIILALLASLMLAIYPQAIIYSRFGFSYNLIVPLVLLTYLGTWRYLDAPLRHPSQQRKGLLLAASAIGLGALSDLWMLSLIAPLIIIICARRWRDLLWSIPLTLIPFVTYVIFMLIQAPQAFLFDLRFTFSRLSGTPLELQLQNLANNYFVLTTQDPWIALAIVGLFLLRPTCLQRLSLLFLLLPIAVLGRTEALYSLSAYYTIPLLPFVALGVANLIYRGTPYIVQVMEDALSSFLGHQQWMPENVRSGLSQKKLLMAISILLFAAIGSSPFIVSTIYSVVNIQRGMGTAIDPFLVNPQDAQRVTEFVNMYTDEKSLVIASPAIAWTFHANTADFQMVAAFAGQYTPHIPANIQRDRFVIEPNYTKVDFVVVDNSWHTWAIYHIPIVAEILNTLDAWILLFESGAIEVYCNPERRNLCPI